MTQAAFSDLPAFGHFRIDIREGVVYRYGTVVRLRRKAFDVLTVLYQHINEFVEYEQIGQLGWKVPSVEKHNIQTTMQEVRRALGAMDGARIENVPMRGYRLVTDEYLEAENRARSEAQVISTQPHTESDPGLLPTEVTSDAVPADRHLEQRVETLEEILLMSRPTADAPIQSIRDPTVELGIRPTTVCLNHRARAREMYYKAAFRSGTTVLYVSIMSESSLKEIKPLLENAKKTRTKLCVLTWNKGISMEIIEALRIHLDENDDDPGLTVRQVRQAALSWRVIEKRYKDNVEVRYYSSCPTFQGLIVKDRWAVIEMLPFHTHPMDRPALILTPTADPELFEMFSGKFESLWRTNGPSSDSEPPSGDSR